MDALSETDASDPLESASRRESYLLAHTKHPDAIYLLTLWRTKPSGEQAEMLAAEARTVNLSECTLVATLTAENSKNSTSAVVSP